LCKKITKNNSETQYNSTGGAVTVYTDVIMWISCMTDQKYFGERNCNGFIWSRCSITFNN